MTMAQGGGKVISLKHRLPLPPGKALGTHFCYRLSRPQGHSAIGRILYQWKIPMTPAGIEPATFRSIAQHRNRFATAVPSPPPPPVKGCNHNNSWCHFSFASWSFTYTATLRAIQNVRNDKSVSWIWSLNSQPHRIDSPLTEVSKYPWKSEYWYFCDERKMATDQIAAFIMLNETKKGIRRSRARAQAINQESKS